MNDHFLFESGHLIHSYEDGLFTSDYTREEIKIYMGRYLASLSQEDLDTTQTLTQTYTAALHVVHDAILKERVRRISEGICDIQPFQD
jgi:hypothetical protein